SAPRRSRCQPAVPGPTPRHADSAPAFGRAATMAHRSLRVIAGGPIVHLAGGPRTWSPRVGDVTIQRMDHVGVVVDDLDAALAFFVELGMERDGGTTAVEGEWVDR